MNKPIPIIEKTVAQLAAEVDHWKARAERAEHDLQFEREQQMRQYPDLWKSYVGVMSLWGGKPAADLRPIAQQTGEPRRAAHP